MSVNPEKFDYNRFKLLIKTQNSKNPEVFEKYLISIKNIKYLAKMLGLWDYEIDCSYKSIKDLHIQIEDLKEKFPDILKQIEILHFEKRIMTTKENFLS